MKSPIKNERSKLSMIVTFIVVVCVVAACIVTPNINGGSGQQKFLATLVSLDIASFFDEELEQQEAPAEITMQNVNIIIDDFMSDEEFLTDDTIADMDSIVSEGQEQQDFSVVDTMPEMDSKASEDVEQQEFLVYDTLSDMDSTVSEDEERQEFSIDDFMPDMENVIDEFLKQQEFAVDDTMPDIESETDEYLEEQEFAVNDTMPDAESEMDEYFEEQEEQTVAAFPGMESTISEYLEEDEVSTVATMPSMDSTVSEYEDVERQEFSVDEDIPDMESAIGEYLEEQEVQTAAAIPGDSPVDEDSEQEEVELTLDQRMEQKISVDFKNTPIEDVIRMIAEQADVDIIKSPTVTGYVTATLTNVPLREALKSILTLHGYGCIIDRNMISVVPIEEIAQQEEILDTRVYHITYADVGEVEAALRRIISKRGSITCSRATSDIIVTDSESKMKAIDSFVERVDRVTPQVLVEVRIYDVSSTEGFDIGADWTAGRNNPVTTVSNSQTVNQSTGQYTDNTTTNTTATTWQENTAGGSTAAYTYRKSKPFIGGDFDETTGGSIRFGFLDTFNVEVALNMLRTQVGSKLLANPRILVLDNEIANFQIITQIPYTEVSTTGNTATQTVKFKDVGVALTVKPHVTRDGMVRLDINPRFDVRVGSTTPPTVDTRTMTTKALVKDGSTVVIGGLRKREVTEEVSKVAVLGDIPLLGTLFQDVEEEVVTNELIIFITPRIVIEPSLTDRENNGLDATNFGGPRVSHLRDED